LGFGDLGHVIKVGEELFEAVEGGFAPIPLDGGFDLGWLPMLEFPDCEMVFEIADRAHQAGGICKGVIKEMSGMARRLLQKFAFREFT
jgi:hypothetical protein